MLNIRQQKILGEFYQFSPIYLTSTHFAKEFDVSLRTIQTDLKQIRQCLAEDHFAVLKSVPSKGSYLEILDMPKCQRFIKSLSGTKSSSEQSQRVRELCNFLLNQHRACSKQKLCAQLYVTSSTLTLDLNKAATIFKKYHLQLQRSSHQGIKVVGSEVNKRQCLLKLGLMETSLQPAQMARQAVIKRIVIQVLLKRHYRISDALFQNLLVHIDISITRIQSGFPIQTRIPSLQQRFQRDYSTAKEIFTHLKKQFYFQVPEGEIFNLAIYLNGKSEYAVNNYISAATDQFILTALQEIKDKFNIDFSQQLDLRLSLALHLIPLFTRVEFDLQNQNQLLDQIKHSYPLAFDIAAYMGLLIQKKMHKKVEEGEIAYLAIYFNQYLTEINHHSGKSKILIITNLKRSEDVLLKQRFITWFAQQIAVLKLVNLQELPNCDSTQFDVIFTTVQTPQTEQLGAIEISSYPESAEYSKIKLAIDGFKSTTEIINLFSPDRFLVGNFVNKKDVLQQLCQVSQPQLKHSQQDLMTAVQLREKLGSSYFGNQVALPHPINPFSMSTLVSVAVVNNHLQWDEDRNQVNLVMLVIIEKNNAKVFQLWNYLGKVIQDPDFTNRILRTPTFENFKTELINLLE